jgi:hypothetical protein
MLPRCCHVAPSSATLPPPPSPLPPHSPPSPRSPSPPHPVLALFPAPQVCPGSGGGEAVRAGGPSVRQGDEVVLERPAPQGFAKAVHVLRSPDVMSPSGEEGLLDLGPLSSPPEPPLDAHRPIPPGPPPGRRRKHVPHNSVPPAIRN